MERLQRREETILRLRQSFKEKKDVCVEEKKSEKLKVESGSQLDPWHLLTGLETDRGVSPVISTNLGRDSLCSEPHNESKDNRTNEKSGFNSKAKTSNNYCCARSCGFIAWAHVCFTCPAFMDVGEERMWEHIFSGEMPTPAPARDGPAGKHSPSLLNNPSRQTIRHFQALGLSLLCVWVEIRASRQSRKVWPRYTL